MPIVRHYIAGQDVVVTRLYGALTDVELRDHVNALTEETRAVSAPVRELADCTGLEDVQGLSGPGVLAAARLEQGRDPALRGPLAIVVSDNLTYGLARMYQAIAEEYRAEVRVFRDQNEAIDWLGLSDLSDEIRALGDAARPGRSEG